MERIVFPVLAEEGELSGFPFDGHFVDAGTPASYIEAMQTSIRNEAWISGDSAEGGNWFGDSVSVASDASISESALDSGGQVAGGSTVVSSALLPNVIVESGCQISGCMIGHNAHIGANSILEDVVVDHGAVVPRGHAQNGGVFPTAG